MSLFYYSIKSLAYPSSQKHIVTVNDVTIDGIILPDERKLTMVNLTQVGSSGEMRITSGSLGFIKFIDEIDQIQGIKGSYSVIASIIS